MEIRAFLLALTLLAPPLVSAQDTPKLPCADKDKACASHAIRNHSVRKFDTWNAGRSMPVDQRITPASPQLVEYLNLDNILNGFPERPRAAKLDAGFLADVKGAIADLPPDIWRLFSERLLGLYFVENLGGTGYTDFVVDLDNKPVAGYIVLDADILGQQTANGWATWKENTPFKVQTAYTLEARIETDANNSRKNAIQYILLHELGHVLSIGGNVHPPWNISPKDVPAGMAYPLFELSWKIDRQANKYRSHFDADFPQRKDVRYYFGAQLPGDEMVPIYANLEKTNFPSLYAATSPGDDFAEAFASYVHVVLMKRPWQIAISHHGELMKVFKPCWEEPRCTEKRKVLEYILKRSS